MARVSVLAPYTSHTLAVTTKGIMVRLCASTDIKIKNSKNIIMNENELYLQLNTETTIILHSTVQLYDFESQTTSRKHRF